MFAFGPGDYAFWLLVISVFCFGLERLFPWRQEQRAFRKGFAQDLFWLAFNGHILGVLLWQGGTWLWATLGVAELLGRLEGVRLLATAPLFVQFLVLLVGKDFLDWNVHRLLHRVGALWRFHKVHHTIEALDWIGNFRFHWVEVLVYRSLTYLPLSLLGVDGRAVFAMALVTTLIGHLNHSNLNLSWGPLGYVLNSPRFHVWHHDVIVRGGHGRNFAVVFSAWDWLFRTAEQPPGQPAKLGFEGMETFPKSLPARLFYPFSQWLSGLRRPRPAARPSA